MPRDLDAALDGCRQALGDYQAGLLDDDQLRAALFDAGVVRRPDEVWLLDLDGGRWWRYDGVSVGVARARVTGAAVARFRHVVDELARALRAPATR